MKRKTIMALILSVSMAASMTCAATAAFAETEDAAETTDDTEAADDAEATDDAEAADDAEETDDASAEDADQEAADKVAALIDAIYVQERTRRYRCTVHRSKRSMGCTDRCTEGTGRGRRGRARSISEEIPETLPRMIRETRMRSVRMSFWL